MVIFLPFRDYQRQGDQGDQCSIGDLSIRSDNSSHRRITGKQLTRWNLKNSSSANALFQVFSTDTVVKDLKVMGSGKEGRRSLAQLAALSTAEVRAFPVQRCDRATTCQKCVALQDPYCAWEIRSSR